MHDSILNAHTTYASPDIDSPTLPPEAVEQLEREVSETPELEETVLQLSESSTGGAGAGIVQSLPRRHEFRQIARKLRSRDQAEQAGDREVPSNGTFHWGAAEVESVAWKLATNYCNEGLPTLKRTPREGQPLVFGEKRFIDVAMRGYDARNRSNPPTAEYLADFCSRDTTTEIEEYISSEAHSRFGIDNPYVACCQLATDSLPRVMWGMARGYDFEAIIFDLPAFQLLTYMPNKCFHETFTAELLYQLWPLVSHVQRVEVAATLIRMYIRRSPSDQEARD